MLRRRRPNKSTSYPTVNGSVMLVCDTGDLTGKLLLAGRLPERRWRCALGAVASVGNCVAICTAAEARACSIRAAAILIVWLASSACFSNALKSSSRKTLHHSPLGTLSLGAPSRQGSGTSHLAGTGAVARLYFGATVQPPATTQAASPKKAGNCFVRVIIVSSFPAQLWDSRPVTQAPPQGPAWAGRSAKFLWCELPGLRPRSLRDSARSSRSRRGPAGLRGLFHSLGRW